MTTTERIPPKPLTVPQCLKMNRQTRNVYFEKLARNVLKLTGILIGGGRFIIWTGNATDPDFEVPEDDKIRTASLLGSSDAILNRKTNFRLIPDIFVDGCDELLDPLLKRRMANDDGEHVCFVNAVHFQTCCTKSNVTHWRYSDQKETGTCVIGLNAQDKPVCALMCIE